jgi:hypothetical protein
MDDGREYIIKELNELIDALGQLVERTTLYTLEQDSKSEQSIYIILDRARCIHINQDIPKFLWDEITSGVVYISNHLSTLVLNRKTLY